MSITPISGFKMDPRAACRGPTAGQGVESEGEVRQGADSGGLLAQGVNWMESGLGWNQAV